MEKLTIGQFAQMWIDATAEVKSKATLFSQLDAVIGDGDHGEAIVTAMNVIAEKSKASVTFKESLNDMAFAVMLETSGSTSTLLGAFLLGLCDGVSPNVTELNANDVKVMFKSGLASVEKNTEAKCGDKTMMDALIPAIESMSGCQSNDIAQIFKAGATAALEGAEKTIGMKANFGRSRNFGDKSIGHKDSGAASWSTIFESFSKTTSILK